MASTTQKYICPCSLCNSTKSVTKRTIQGHLKHNQAQLQDLVIKGGSQQTIDYLQRCYDQTTWLLARLAGGSQGSSQSPHPDGVCLFIPLFILVSIATIFL